MLLTIHNLPPHIRYSDVKSLLHEKVGLSDLILDKIIPEGSTKRVTVGVSNEVDAANLVHKINGLYMDGVQLYVEDVRKKRETKQPIPSTSIPEKVPKQRFQKQAEQRYPAQSGQQQGYPAMAQRLAMQAQHMMQQPMSTSNNSMMGYCKPQMQGPNVAYENQPFMPEMQALPEIPAAPCSRSPHRGGFQEQRPQDQYNSARNDGNSFRRKGSPPRNSERFKPHRGLDFERNGQVDSMFSMRGTSVNNMQQRPLLEPPAGRPPIHEKILPRPDRLSRPEPYGVNPMSPGPRTQPPNSRFHEQRTPGFEEPRNSKNHFTNGQQRRPPEEHQGNFGSARFSDGNRDSNLEPPVKKTRPSEPSHFNKPTPKGPTGQLLPSLEKLMRRHWTRKGQAAAVISKEIMQNVQKQRKYIPMSYELKALKQAIRTRLDEILVNKMGVCYKVMVTEYRNKYGPSTDIQLFNLVLVRVNAEQKAAKAAAASGMPSPEVKPVFLAPATQVISGEPAAAPKPTTPNENAAHVPAGKLPRFPKGEQRTFQQQKQLQRKELAGEVEYTLEPPLQAALDSEMSAIQDILRAECTNTQDDAEKVVCKHINNNAADELKKKIVRLAELVEALCRKTKSSRGENIRPNAVDPAISGICDINKNTMQANKPISSKNEQILTHNSHEKSSKESNKTAIQKTKLLQIIFKLSKLLRVLFINTKHKLEAENVQQKGVVTNSLKIVQNERSGTPQNNLQITPSKETKFIIRKIAVMVKMIRLLYTKIRNIEHISTSKQKKCKGLKMIVACAISHQVLQTVLKVKSIRKSLYKIVRHELRLAVLARIDGILKNKMTVPCDDMIKLYLKKYPLEQDQELFNMAIAKLNVQRNDLDSNIEVRTEVPSEPVTTVFERADNNNQTAAASESRNKNTEQSSVGADNQDCNEDRNVAPQNETSNGRPQSSDRYCEVTLNEIKAEENKEITLNNIVKNEEHTETNVHIKTEAKTEGDKEKSQGNMSSSQTKSVPPPSKLKETLQCKNKNRHGIKTGRQFSRVWYRRYHYRRWTSTEFYIRRMKQRISAATNLQTQIQTMEKDIAASITVKKESVGVIAKQELEEGVRVKQELEEGVRVKQELEEDKSIKNDLFQKFKVKIEPKSEGEDDY